MDSVSCRRDLCAGLHLEEVGAMSEPTRYYYVCDNCGTYADITEAKHLEDVTWACGECNSTALWEFTDKDKSWQHGEHIRNKRYAAQLAQLDQAYARLDEAEGKS